MRAWGSGAGAKSMRGGGLGSDGGRGATGRGAEGLPRAGCGPYRPDPLVQWLRDTGSSPVYPPDRAAVPTPHPDNWVDTRLNSR